MQNHFINKSNEPVEEIDNNYDEIVDNLKHFTVASKSRFALLEPGKKEFKNSYSSIETTDTNANNQEQSILHKSSYDYPHQIKSTFYQGTLNYFTNKGRRFNVMTNQANI